MRLGAYTCLVKQGTLAHKLYGKDQVSERHRHRYEFNNVYRKRFEDAGLVFSGVNPDLDLVEMIEVRGHPHFLGCQFHPEFKSRPASPHPLFAGFIRSALVHRDQTVRGAPAPELVEAAPAGSYA
jgi:CTP synthase